MNGSRRPKSRLCIKGCQEDKNKCPSTFAPTASKETIMIALHTIAANGWKMTAMDVEKAFLQSAEIDREVYVYPPEEADLPLNTIWKLLKPAYGLNDAARGWHKTLRQILLNLGMTESNSDKALFYMKTNDGELHGIIVEHVDDLLVAGDDIFYELIERIKTFIKMGKEKTNNFKFCGMSIITSKTGEITIGVDTEKVGSVQQLQTIRQTSKRQLSEEEDQAIRSRIGTLQWFATLIRPDLCIEFSRALSYLNREHDTDLLPMMNKIIKKFNDKRFHFHKIAPLKGDIELEVHGDASFKKKETNQHGLVVIIRQNATQKANLISWKSNAADRTAWSTGAAETFALQQALDKTVYIKNMLMELNSKIIKTTAYTHNLSLRRVLYSGKATKELRLRREIAAARDLLTHD